MEPQQNGLLKFSDDGSKQNCVSQITEAAQKTRIQCKLPLKIDGTLIYSLEFCNSKCHMVYNSPGN